LRRDPRFRAASIAYTASIMNGSVHSSGEGKPCWRKPSEVFGKLAFDCEDMLNDYLNGRQCLS
jgi:8-oxo-dGTP diphosphatase